MIVDWLIGNGAELTRVSLASDGEWGGEVRARVDIRAGERVLTIPHGCLLTTERVMASAVGRALGRAGPTPAGPAGRHAILAAGLLHERDDPRSFFRPYLDALPSSLPWIPLLYGERELSLLEGSYLLDRIAARSAVLRRDHEDLRRVPELARFSYEDFVWARFAIWSRVFALRVEREKTQGMVPMGDMLNHAPSAEVRWGYAGDGGGFFMEAVRDVQAGEPLCTSYGHKCNARFLMSYGFVLDHNEDNLALVDLTMPRSTWQYRTKLRLLGEARARLLVSPRLNDEGAQSALSFLRIVHATPAELARACVLDGAPLGARNEAQALRALAAACQDARSRFRSTEAEDDALLKGGTLSPTARSCVIMRRGEKQVLRRLQAAAEEAADQPERMALGHPSRDDAVARPPG